MAQRGQFPSNLIQDILTEQHQLSQQQQNMLGIYSNMDREVCIISNIVFTL